ncbi:MAG: hypothetical protein R3C49_20330 [Planctomycetaceae bacterium]
MPFWGRGSCHWPSILIIAAHEDCPQLNLYDTSAFLQHVLERIDPTRDLHFQTQTTIDTLDYTGSGLNQGSKLIIAAAGNIKRTLPTELTGSVMLPEGFCDPRVCLPGVLAIRAPAVRVGPHQTDPALEEFCQQVPAESAIGRFPLVVLCDDSEFCSRTLANFLWVTFTRSNPAADVSGLGSFVQNKHWGCRSSIVIDARIKPHMAPPLEPDPQISRHVDRLFVRGGPLHGIG